MSIPENVRQLAEACHLKIHGWDDDEDSAVIVNAPPNRDDRIPPAVNYIGTRAECVAFLTAWSACMGHKLADLMEESAAQDTIRHDLLIVNSLQEIGPAQTATITIRPQIAPFRGQRLAVPASIAESFDIMDFRVGNRSQLPMPESIPAIAYAVGIDTAPIFRISEYQGGAVKMILDRGAQAEFGRKMAMETCQVAMDITMMVMNTSDQDKRFVAMIAGVSARIF